MGEIDEGLEERKPMDWLYDMKSREVHEILTAKNKLGEDSSVRLVYEHCGLDVLVSLWQNLPSITIYISERALNDLRKLYVRQNHNKKDPQKSIKVLAATLRTSEQFVRQAIWGDKKGVIKRKRSSA